MTTKHDITMIDEAVLRLKDVRMPAYYLNYQHNILKNVQKNFELAAKARKLGLDVSDGVEPKIAYDLADRVAKMHNIDIADRLRVLLSVVNQREGSTYNCRRDSFGRIWQW